jgi:hypothetical protein
LGKGYFRLVPGTIEEVSAVTITVPVPLTSEELAALQVEAEAQGVSVDNLLRKAVLHILSASRKVKPQQDLSPEEFDRALEEIADMIPDNVPDIPDEALSRDSIYTREDEWDKPIREGKPDR